MVQQPPCGCLNHSAFIRVRMTQILGSEAIKFWNAQLLQEELDRRRKKATNKDKEPT